MRTDQDLERAVRLWVAHGSDRLPDPALDAALDQIATTKQRHAGWLARRTNLMNGNTLKFGVAAVAIIAAALLGVRFLPSMVGGPPDPTPTPIPTPVSLASGSFTAGLSDFGETFAIEATGAGDDVSGTLDVSTTQGDYSVDLQCARVATDGLIVIAGKVSESTSELIVDGAYVAILFAPSTPVRTVIYVDVLPTDEVPAPAASCAAYLDTVLSDPGANVDDIPVAIQGDLELNP